MNPIRIIYTPIPQAGFSEQWCTAVEAILDRHELSRLASYKHKTLKHRFLLGRLLIKTEVSRRLHCEPKDVRLAYSANGKPYVRAHPELAISISHCDSWVAVALASENMGIDIESLMRSGEPWNNAARLLNTSVADTLKQVGTFGTTVPAMFGAIWCCMESQVKVKDSSVFSERKLMLPTHFNKGKTYAIECDNNQPFSAAAYTIGDAILAVALKGSFSAEAFANRIVLEENLASVDYDNGKIKREHPNPFLMMTGAKD
ncbi:hypothetical protein KO528_15440 [Saccharophagus degradans]|uniref:4'-phosphopantetheinyl transferase family protein n=1 Tax=Saccharophagus degradans TaxID=86304 RepID=UPI001C07EFB1|nr:hypothetical protein [Saccharophagus degradans]MBU2986758.1 hypothetical protein [Saccharophagus degradans]